MFGYPELTPASVITVGRLSVHQSRTDPKPYGFRVHRLVQLEGIQHGRHNLNHYVSYVDNVGFRKIRP